MSLADRGHCPGNRGQWKGLGVLPLISLGLRTPPLPIGRSGGSRWSVTESILFFFNCYQGCVFVVVLFYFWLCWSLLSSSFLHGLSLVTVNRGYSLVVGRGLLTAVSSFVAEHGLSCLMKCSILVLRPGIELTSPALAGTLPATGPPERSPPHRPTESIPSAQDSESLGGNIGHLVKTNIDWLCPSSLENRTLIPPVGM